MRGFYKEILALWSFFWVPVVSHLPCRLTIAYWHSCRLGATAKRDLHRVTSTYGHRLTEASILLHARVYCTGAQGRGEKACLPDVSHGIPDAGVGIMLVAVQLWNEGTDVGLQPIACQLGD